MKYIKKILICTAVSALCCFNLSSIHAIDTSSYNGNANEHNIFISQYTDGNIKIDQTKEGIFYIQDFKKVVEMPTLKSAISMGLSTYKVTLGREILNQKEFKARTHEQKSRATTSDSHDDGRGTHVYAEIVYTKGSRGDMSIWNMKSIYCNASGSTLSKYSVTYGQSGPRASNYMPIHQSKTSNINTTYKTFSTNLNWEPVLSGGSWGPGSGVVGMTQTFTSHGYSNKWTFNLTD